MSIHQICFGIYWDYLHLHRRRWMEVRVSIYSAYNYHNSLLLIHPHLIPIFSHARIWFNFFIYAISGYIFTKIRPLIGTMWIIISNLLIQFSFNIPHLDSIFSHYRDLTFTYVSSRALEIQICLATGAHPSSASQVSLYLVHRFLSNFSCYFAWVICSVLFACLFF